MRAEESTAAIPPTIYCTDQKLRTCEIIEIFVTVESQASWQLKLDRN
jgi:hypothetical protein